MRVSDICPEYVGEQLLTIALGPATLSPRAFNALDITIDYAKAVARGGVVLPLELVITAPSSSNFVRRFFRRTAPTTISFVPREGGRHLIRLAESAHNQWWGSLVVEVSGEQTDPRNA